MHAFLYYGYRSADGGSGQALKVSCVAPAFATIGKWQLTNTCRWKLRRIVDGMFGLGQTEILVFVAILLVLFGSARLPSLMRNLGRSANEFKAGMRDPVSKDSDSSGEEESSDSKAENA